MSTERTKIFRSPATEKLNSPAAELVPPLHSSLPCTTRRTAMEGCWERHQFQQPAAGNLSFSWRAEDRVACQTSCSAARWSPPAGEGATCCWYPHTGQSHLAQGYLGCLQTFWLQSGTAKGSTAPMQSFWATLSPLPVWTTSLVLHVLWELSERDPHFMFRAGQICATNIGAELRLPALQLQQLASLAPLPQAAASPNEDFSITYNNQPLWEWVATSKPTSSVLPVKCIHKLSHKYHQPDDPRSTEKTEKTSINLQTQSATIASVQQHRDMVPIIQCYVITVS